VAEYEPSRHALEAPRSQFRIAAGTSRQTRNSCFGSAFGVRIAASHYLAVPSCRQSQRLRYVRPRPCVQTGVWRSHTVGDDHPGVGLRAHLCLPSREAVLTAWRNSLECSGPHHHMGLTKCRLTRCRPRHAPIAGRNLRLTLTDATEIVLRGNSAVVVLHLPLRGGMMPAISLGRSMPVFCPRPNSVAYLAMVSMPAFEPACRRRCRTTPEWRR